MRRIVLGLTLAWMAFGQTGARETDTRKLLELMGTRKLGVAAARQMLQQLKPILLNDLPPGERSEKMVAAFEQKLLAKLDSDEVVARLVPVYTKAFTHAEIKGLIKFFDSPLGRRYVELMPSLDAAFQSWAQEFLPQILADLQKEFPELAK